MKSFVKLCVKNLNEYFYADVVHVPHIGPLATSSASPPWCADRKILLILITVKQLFKFKHITGLLRKLCESAADTDIANKNYRRYRYTFRVYCVPFLSHAFSEVYNVGKYSSTASERARPKTTSSVDGVTIVFSSWFAESYRLFRSFDVKRTFSIVFCGWMTIPAARRRARSELKSSFDSLASNWFRLTFKSFWR